jgi:predicted TIM-barrel fold metal-dependent hydrolase
MKLGRFVVDTHVHSQRHAAGAALKGSKDYGDLGKTMSQVVAYDNSPRLLYDMECYGVDMCVVQCAGVFGMTNEINVEQVKKHPDKFVANCFPQKTRHRMMAGEKVTIDDVCAEIDELLKTGDYVGIGEGVWGAALNREDINEKSIIEFDMKICEVCQQHNVPFRYHTGTPGGYAVAYHPGGTTFNPLWAHTLAVNFPKVSIILEHGGIEGGWWEYFYEQCLHVAAGHKNIYLETGRYWTELYYKALNDPSVGPEKLLWGTDWGASLPLYSQPGRYPSVYTRQNLKEGIIRHQHDIWGWSLRQLAALEISQDDLNLILGGNAVRLYNLKLPGGLTRMFKFVD